MEGPVYLRFIVSLVLVLGLLLAVLWALRRFGVGGMVARPSARRRLSVVETMALDGRRRLVLIKRDDCEHLLMIGGPNDMVIERGNARETLKEDQV
ncbi:MAG: flagellar biosynthetic protein FliO [Rhodospirillaceae bacterium]|nr:flagellar biosynthetic protein FliO [Rhodospirillales bacterium]